MTSTLLRIVTLASLLAGVATLTACQPSSGLYPGVSAQIASAPMVAPTALPVAKERYPAVRPNRFQRPVESPVSTFSLDVDTAAYSNVRRMLTAGQMPPMDAVRIEEMVNYFDYAYQRPETADTPFATNVAMVPAPWNQDHLLLHVGVKGYEIQRTQRPGANLVLLLDVSGSMAGPGRLDLVKKVLSSHA